MKKKISVDLPFWKEYPERDTEFVRVYPTIYNKVKEEDIWTKGSMGFYLSLPFCDKTCFNCPFKKNEPRIKIVDKYINALKHEIDFYADKTYVKDHFFYAGYIGGATPTSLSPDQLTEIIQYIKQKFPIASDFELSIETEPVTFTKEIAAVLKENGFNRISFGIQSFSNQELKLIGREYTTQKALEAIKIAQRTGFENINIDLLYGLPEQTLETWKKSLDIAMTNGADNVSIYQFVQLEGTTGIVSTKNKSTPKALNKDEEMKLLTFTRDELGKAGYQKVIGDGFESYLGFIFAKEDKTPKYQILRSQIDLKVIGLGIASLSNIRKHWYLNETDINKYIKSIEEGRLPISTGATITQIDRCYRGMILGARLGKINRQTYKSQYGVDITFHFDDQIKELEKLGLVKLTDDDLVIQFPEGYYYLTNISKIFFNDKYKRCPQVLGQAKEVKKWNIT